MYFSTFGASNIYTVCDMIVGGIERESVRYVYCTFQPLVLPKKEVLRKRYLWMTSVYEVGGVWREQRVGGKKWRNFLRQTLQLGPHPSQLTATLQSNAIQ